MDFVACHLEKGLGGYGCITNYPRTQWFKTTPIISHTPLEATVHCTQLVFCSTPLLLLQPAGLSGQIPPHGMAEVREQVTGCHSLDLDVPKRPVCYR
jgi:hypothetical protein